MKKILTWVNIATICMVDGFMQDQEDTAVTLMGVHMDAIEKKFADAKTIIAGVPALTKRAEDAEAALIEAKEVNDANAPKVTALEAQIADLTTKLEEANAKLEKANKKLANRGDAPETITETGQGGKKGWKPNAHTLAAAEWVKNM